MNKSVLLTTVLLLNMLWAPTAAALVCSVSSSNLSFGSFNPLLANTADSTGTITVSCLLLASYNIALSPGSSGTYTSRRMANGGNHLEYNLYRDAGYSQIWGNGTGGSYTVNDSILIIGSKNHTVYGRIPLSTQRGAMVGSYSDSITVTITYN
jgi:spore coat protein U domain-containing protein, fimbrial subunit CupE1/2/3/6